MINAVQILITTVCDRRCADCCQSIPRKAPGRHGTWEEFEHAAKYLHGYPLTICGGETTMHPEFKRIAREFRQMFKAPYMEVMSNGYGIIEHGDVLDFFNMVRITRYPSKSTKDAIAWAREHIPGRVRTEIETHIPLDHIGRGEPCFRRHAPIYSQGWLYPCCVATGFEDAASIHLSDDWLEQIESTALECSRCIFSSQGDE
jgi:hypothetical protein